MKKLKPWPIVVGILIDTLGSIGIGVFYFVVVFGLHIVRGAPPGEESLSARHRLSLRFLGCF